MANVQGDLVFKAGTVEYLHHLEKTRAIKVCYSYLFLTISVKYLGGYSDIVLRSPV